MGDDENDSYREVGNSRHPSTLRHGSPTNAPYTYSPASTHVHAGYGQQSYLQSSQLRPGSSHASTAYAPVEGHSYAAAYGNVPQASRFPNPNYIGQSSHPTYTSDPSKPYIPLTPEDRRALGAFRVAL